MKSLFLQHLEDSFYTVLKAPVLVACSGGLDSVALVHLLHSAGCSLGLAHCNFNLRGKESDADQQLVYDLAKRLSLPFYQISFNTREVSIERGISIQMAARALRYEWFEEIATNFDYHHIATAHHANDDLETMLINLSRGSGLKGLCGIPPINDKVVRPLLPFTREQIYNFAKEERITWREDSSNLSTQYLRNALRHEVLPVFLRYFPSLQTGSYRSRSHLAGASSLVDDYMRIVSQKVVSTFEDTVQIDLDKLKAFPHTDEILFHLLDPYGFTAWKDVFGLLKAQSGKQVHSASHILLKDRNRLILAPAGEEGTSQQPIIISSLEELADIPWLEYSMVDRLGETGPEVAYLAYEKLDFPLEIRPWREGDHFYPFGMTGKKKLSKFFKDEKLSLHAKKRVRLLCSNGEIVWIIGFRADDRFKVQERLPILKLTFLEKTT